MRFSEPSPFEEEPMWRLFRWLDDHPPTFYKFTLMFAGFGAVVLATLGLALLHPAAGIVFAYVAVFGLIRASHTYRFKKKPKSEPQSTLPIREASEREIVRRVRRFHRTSIWGRVIREAQDEPGRRGDLARSIVRGWEEAEAARPSREDGAEPDAANEGEHPIRDEDAKGAP